MNKKTFGIIGVIVLVILLIIACCINPNKTIYSDDPNIIVENATEEAANVNDAEIKEFIEINVDEYLDIYNGEEKQLVLIAIPTCHYCQIAEPILHNIAYVYDLKINYLNTDNFKDDDTQKFINSDEIFKEGYGTPTLIVAGKGSIIDIQNSLTDTNHYISFFKKNGYIQ